MAAVQAACSVLDQDSRLLMLLLRLIAAWDAIQAAVGRLRRQWAS